MYVPSCEFEVLYFGIKLCICFYSGEEICENNDSQTDEEEWPPFKRVGNFDPYSDDPRLAVKRVSIYFSKHIFYLYYTIQYTIQKCRIFFKNKCTTVLNVWTF